MPQATVYLQWYKLNSLYCYLEKHVIICSRHFRQYHISSQNIWKIFNILEDIPISRLPSSFYRNDSQRGSSHPSSTPMMDSRASQGRWDDPSTPGLLTHTARCTLTPSPRGCSRPGIGPLLGLHSRLPGPPTGVRVPRVLMAHASVSTCSTLA